jgi:hypothetical protein
MQPTENPNPQLKVLRQSTIMAMAEDMNGNQAVAVALLPRFGLEITIDQTNQQFQVNVAELNTGHDIRLSRDVAHGISEAMRQLVEKIDEHLKTQGIEIPRPEANA